MYPNISISVRENLEAGKYNNPVERKGRVYHRKDPNVLTKDGGYVMSSRDEWIAEEVRINNQFMEDLFKENGVENNPKRIKCFNLAWEHGHSAGYSEVICYFEEFVELIK